MNPVSKPMRARRAPLFVRAALAAVSTAVVGIALAQAPTPQPAVARPAALSDALPIPPAPAPKTAAAWILMDFATGQVLAGENYDKRHEPASITKVMTSYVVAAEMAAGKVHPDDQVMMTEHAWREGGAGTQAAAGELRPGGRRPFAEDGAKHRRDQLADHGGGEADRAGDAAGGGSESIHPGSFSLGLAAWRDYSMPAPEEGVREISQGGNLCSRTCRWARTTPASEHSSVMASAV